MSTKTLDNFSTFLQRLNIDCDIIIVTECWLAIVNNNLPFMEGYRAHYTKTSHNQNDGVIVFARNSLNISVEEQNIEDCSCLLVKIESMFAILAVYRSPSFNNTDSFLDSLHANHQKILH